MAYTLVPLTTAAWVLISNGTKITFQNQSINPIYIQVADTLPAPSEVGVFYEFAQGELARDIATMTTGSGVNVYARAASKNSKVLIETT